MPKKPTLPFGHIAFSKDGRVSRRMFQLSTVKEEQELEAIGRFVERFNRIDEKRQISDLMQLSEADHDFSALVDGRRIEIQLTELVQHSYIFPMTDDEYREGRWPCVVVRGPNQTPMRLDEELRDRALCDVVEKKVRKHYASTEGIPVWLVVFSTSSYATEYFRDGQLRVSEALSRARRYLASAKFVFCEVWFTNLQSRPIRIWPVTELRR